MSAGGGTPTYLDEQKILAEVNLREVKKKLSGQNILETIGSKMQKLHATTLRGQENSTSEMKDEAFSNCLQFLVISVMEGESSTSAGQHAASDIRYFETCCFVEHVDIKNLHPERFFDTMLLLLELQE